MAPPKLKSSPYLSLAIIGVVIVLILVIIKVFIPLVSGKSLKKVTLTYWGLWEDQSIMEGVIADFEAKNPGITINYRPQQKFDYRSRLAGRLTKDPSTDEVPDIFRFHSSWLPMLSASLLTVPDSVSKSIGLDTDYYAVFKHDLKPAGKYLGIPLMYDGLALFYNQDLLEKSQVSLPKTWWDLQTAASTLTVRDSNGRLKVAGVAMGLTDNVDQWSDIVGILLKQNGADITKNNPENNDKIKDVLSYYTNFYTQYKTWDDTMPPSTLAFAQGKLAFYFGPSWRVFNFQDLNPSLRFSITTVPQLATGDQNSLTNIHWATYWAEGVNRRSPHAAEAWKFLEYLSTPAALEKMYSTASQTRAFGEIYPRISLGNQIQSTTLIKPFISVANDAESGYLASFTYDAGLNTNLAKYFGDAINSIALNHTDPASAVTTLRPGLNQIIQRYQLK